MFVAVVVTLVRMQSETGIIGWPLLVGGLVVGGAIGAWMAIRVEMTGMPEMGPEVLEPSDSRNTSDSTRYAASDAFRSEATRQQPPKKAVYCPGCA